MQNEMRTKMEMKTNDRSERNRRAKKLQIMDGNNQQAMFLRPTSIGASRQ
jgi:hypothetical protein